MIQENTVTLSRKLSDLLERCLGKDVGTDNRYFRVGKQLKDGNEATPKEKKVI